MSGGLIIIIINNASIVACSRETRLLILIRDVDRQVAYQIEAILDVAM